MIYSGRDSGSVCQSGDPVFGSSGNYVHAGRKYCLNRLFSGNKRFNRNPNLQNSRVLTPVSFPMGFYMQEMTAGPLLPDARRTSEIRGPTVGLSQESFEKKSRFHFPGL